MWCPCNTSKLALRASVTVVTLLVCVAYGLQKSSFAVAVCYMNCDVREKCFVAPQFCHTHDTNHIRRWVCICAYRWYIIAGLSMQLSTTWPGQAGQSSSHFIISLSQQVNAAGKSFGRLCLSVSLQFVLELLKALTENPHVCIGLRLHNI